MTSSRINTKILAVRIVSILIAIAMIITLAGCGDSLSGTYEEENGGDSIKFTSSRECTLYDEDGAFYYGTYKKTDKGYEILVQTPSGPQGVIATKDGKDLIITGGNKRKKRFVIVSKNSEQFVKKTEETNGGNKAKFTDSKELQGTNSKPMSAIDKERKARTDVNTIAAAIKAFEAEYGRFPKVGTNNVLSDADFDMLIRILACAAPDQPGMLWSGASGAGNDLTVSYNNNEWNPRLIRFLELPAEYFEDKGFNDPWGNRYTVMIDYSGNGGLTAPDENVFPATERGKRVSSNVAVYSKGAPNAKKGIGSWQ